MIEDEFEAQYNIRRRHPESSQHYARYEADSAAARTALSGRIDLRYGDAEGERLDFFPASEADAPLFLFIHGGYWRALDKGDFSFIAPPFIAAGIAVTLINYGLTPRVTVEEIVAQTQRAIGWTHRNAGLGAAAPDEEEQVLRRFLSGVRNQFTGLGVGLPDWSLP